MVALMKVVEEKIKQTHNEIWGWVMKEAKLASGDLAVSNEQAMAYAWDRAVVHFGITGATGGELSEYIYKMHASRARQAKAKQSRRIGRALSKLPKGSKSQLAVLEAERKAIEKKIKLLMESDFRGEHFQVGQISEKWCVKHGKQLVVYLPREEANNLAKKLEAICLSLLSKTSQT